MIRLFTLALLLITAIPANAASLLEALTALDASLDEAQRASLHYPFEADERLNWHFIPKDRNGLSLNGMDEKQTRCFLDVLRAATSESGFETVETIRSLELVLREIEGGAGLRRDPLYYFLTTFGEPSDTGTWSLRFEGHHISMHWVFIEGKPYASTPQFLGSNPGTVRQGDKKGTRPLGQTQDLALALVNGLSEDQRAAVVVDATAPRDIVSGTAPGPDLPAKTGLPISKLNEDQQRQLMELVNVIALIQRPDFYQERIERVKKDRDSITFTWMGGFKDGEPHYYRIQGDTFLVEYDNVQNDANHIHTVWRDATADFGADMLKAHYTAIPHGRALTEVLHTQP